MPRKLRFVGRDDPSISRLRWGCQQPQEGMVIHMWPFSQICIGCIHSRFVPNDELTVLGVPHDEQGSVYECRVQCMDNNGSNCPKLEMPSTQNDQSTKEDK